MINLILGLDHDQLQLNDLMGILDLYHKYNGTFIELRELESLIINAIISDSHKQIFRFFDSYD